MKDTYEDQIDTQNTYIYTFCNFDEFQDYDDSDSHIQLPK